MINDRLGNVIADNFYCAGDGKRDHIPTEFLLMLGDQARHISHQPDDHQSERRPAPLLRRADCISAPSAVVFLCTYRFLSLSAPPVVLLLSVYHSGTLCGESWYTYWREPVRFCRRELVHFILLLTHSSLCMTGISMLCGESPPRRSYRLRGAVCY